MRKLLRKIAALAMAATVSTTACFNAMTCNAFAAPEPLLTEGDLILHTNKGGLGFYSENESLSDVLSKANLAKGDTMTIELINNELTNCVKNKMEITFEINQSNIGDEFYKVTDTFFTLPISQERANAFSNSSDNGWFEFRIIFGSEEYFCDSQYNVDNAKREKYNTLMEPFHEEMKIHYMVSIYPEGQVPTRTDTNNEKSISSCSFSKISNKAYTGKALKPSVTVKDGTKTLKKGTDYTVSYKNNTKVGTAKVTITGKGNYTGKKTLTFKIVPKKTKLSVKNITSNKVDLSWKKSTGAEGYQVYCSTNGGSYKKVATVKSAAAISKTITNLNTDENTYKFKVRPYATSGKTTFYGSWSNVITIG